MFLIDELMRQTALLPDESLLQEKSNQILTGGVLLGIFHTAPEHWVTLVLGLYVRCLSSLILKIKAPYCITIDIHTGSVADP
jgi:hypothetical protein